MVLFEHLLNRFQTWSKLAALSQRYKYFINFWRMSFILGLENLTLLSHAYTAVIAVVHAAPGLATAKSGRLSMSGMFWNGLGGCWQTSSPEDAAALGWAQTDARGCSLPAERGDAGRAPGMQLALPAQLPRSCYASPPLPAAPSCPLALPAGRSSGPAPSAPGLRLVLLRSSHPSLLLWPPSQPCSGFPHPPPAPGCVILPVSVRPLWSLPSRTSAWRFTANARPRLTSVSPPVLPQELIEIQVVDTLGF